MSSSNAARQHSGIGTIGRGSFRKPCAGNGGGLEAQDIRAEMVSNSKDTSK